MSTINYDGEVFTEATPQKQAQLKHLGLNKPNPNETMLPYVNASNSKTLKPNALDEMTRMDFRNKSMQP